MFIKIHYYKIPSFIDKSSRYRVSLHLTFYICFVSLTVRLQTNIDIPEGALDKFNKTHVFGKWTYRMGGTPEGVLER